MSSIFANIRADGTVIHASGVVGVTRGDGLVPPETYILELDRELDPDRCHISASCRAVAPGVAPVDTYNTGFIDGRHMGVTWLQDGTLCSVPFTITIEEF